MIQPFDPRWTPPKKTNEEKNMKLNNMLLLTCLASVAYCGSTSKRHPDETKRMFVADEPRILVFHDNATGDSSASLAAQGALLSKLGTAKFVPNGAGIPNDIAKKLVESAFANGGKIESSDPLFDITMKGVEVALKVFNAEFVVFVSADKDTSGIPVPSMLKVKYYAAIYDVKTKTVVAAVTDDGTMVQQAAVAQLPLGVRSLMTYLIDGKNAEDAGSGDTAASAGAPEPEPAKETKPAKKGKKK